MDIQGIEHKLTTDRLPEMELPLRKRKLKSALLSSARYSRPLNARNAPALSVFTFPSMINVKKPLIATGLFAILMAAAFGFGRAGEESTPYAQAQELVKAAEERMEKLPSDELTRIEAAIHKPVADALAEAYAAPDLRRMNRDEFAMSLDDNTFGPVPHVDWTAEQAPTVPKPSYVFGLTEPEGAKEDDYLIPIETYLVYTDPLGFQTALGLDKDNVLRIRIQVVPDDRTTVSEVAP